MGQAWGDLVDETDHFDFLRSMDLAIPCFSVFAMVPLLRKLVFSKLFLSLAGPRLADKEGMGRSLRSVRKGLYHGIDHTSDLEEAKVISSGRELKATVNARFEADNPDSQCRQRGDMLVSEDSMPQLHAVDSR